MMCPGGARWLTLACTLSLLVAASPISAEECMQGARCSQCPAGHFTRATNGTLLCCPSCAAATLYHGNFPSGWCACYPGSATQSSLVPRMIRFPGPSNLSPTGTEDPLDALSIKDALYIVNQGGGGLGHPEISGGRGGRGGASPAVQHALTLLADTLEDLHVRVSRLEAIIARSQDLQQSGSINRVGTVPPPTAPPTERSCPTNYSRIGDICYYVSVWHDYRAIWKDARAACEGLGGKLAEPLTRVEFMGLTRQLNTIPSASGFSYWLGGLYPGMSWLWAYAGERVTLTPAYWAEKDSSGKRVTPGDTSSGRCLSLAYRVESSKYYYSAEECGFEKYFICQLVDGGQQRMLEL